MTRDQERRCGCDCHASVVIHITSTCDCGKPVRPPRPGCPPPKIEPQPGTVDVPQDQPPPHPRTSDQPSWSDRPPAGDPGEIPWLRGKIGDIIRKGPTFGPRKDEFLPYLVVRSASGDRGARPLGGVFWESPDIYVVPNQDAGAAPLMPATQGGVAVANAPNTLYAHVWNLGKAPAFRVRVEFYWFNPSLGISRADAYLVGAAWVDLADRFTLYPQWQQMTESSGAYITRGCHAIVRCPQTWFPTFENNGHECLVVRAFEPILDAVDYNQFSPAADRHVGQRNIAVVISSSPASIDLSLNLGYAGAPSDAEVDVRVENPGTMEWLRLYTGRRDPGLVPPAAATVAGFAPPTIAGTRTLDVARLPFDGRELLLRPSERFHRGCEPLRVLFHASARDLKEKQAQVLRVRQRIDGNVIGGYSVVLIGAER